MPGVRDENGYPKIENPRSLPSVAEASQECRGCHLWARATQTVFGEGPRSANVLFVGEQPGDKEDLAGHPFVGPLAVASSTRLWPTRASTGSESSLQMP